MTTFTYTIKFILGLILGLIIYVIAIIPILIYNLIDIPWLLVEELTKENFHD